MKNKILAKTFGWLFVGLLICFGVSFSTTYSSSMIRLIYGSLGGYGYLLFLGLEIILAIAISAFITKMNPIVARLLYLLYAALTGLSLTGIFIVYTSSSIAFVFLASALVFGAFCLVGFFTKMDLSKWSTYLFMALIAIIILNVINIFVMNHTLNMFLCIVGILLFCAYTAYDIQKLKDDEFLMDSNNKSVFCAFQLFIDFINIFLDLLHLFGESK
jgi:FtsH-binding integral membrane protein